MDTHITPAANPRKHFIIGLDGNSFTLWGPAPAAGPRRGLLCLVAPDPAPVEDRHDNTVRVFAIDDHQPGPRAGVPGVDMILNWSFGEVTLPVNAPSSATAEAQRRFLEQSLDGDTLDWFFLRWVAARGLTPRREASAQLPDWEPGVMVTSLEALDCRMDRYRADGKVYLADPAFCVTPGCDCVDARVLFYEEPQRNHLHEVGSVVVNLHLGAPVEWDPFQCSRVLLKTLYLAFKERHGDLHMMRQRREQMAGLGARLLKAAHRPYRAAAKVSRNDPCPCGSGKKYKRCCQLRAASSAAG